MSASKNLKAGLGYEVCLNKRTANEFLC